MKTAEILESLDRIKMLVLAISTPDGSISVVETKVAILLETCEQLLQDSRERMETANTRSSD